VCETWACRFSAIYFKETFSNLGLNEKLKGGRKNVHFQRKTVHISEMVRDKAKVTINH